METNKELNQLRTQGEWDSDLHDGNVSCGGMIVANCNSMFISKQTSTANAKYICHAVNNHEALLEALKELREVKNSSDWDRVDNAWEAAIEAINKATL